MVCLLFALYQSHYSRADNPARQSIAKMYLQYKGVCSTQEKFLVSEGKVFNENFNLEGTMRNYYNRSCTHSLDPPLSHSSPYSLLTYLYFSLSLPIPLSLILSPRSRLISRLACHSFPCLYNSQLP